MSIIIVEGCDLAGKTYFIEKFSKHMNSGITIKNNLKPNNKDSPDQIYEQYRLILELADQFVSKSYRLVILDRFFPSQAVYSFFRGVDEIGDKRILALHNIALLMGIKMIYLNTPLETLQERYDVRGDEHVSKKDLVCIHDRYNRYIETCPFQVLKLDTMKAGWLEKAQLFVEREN